MRLLVSIFFVGFLAVSCVKKTSTDPVPVIDYVSAGNMYRTAAGNDTAVFVIDYQDGDGDLFVDNYDQAYNFFMSTYYYSDDSAKFLLDKSFANKLLQPDNGYYKGKAIKGQVIIPTKEYRSNSSKKIIKFEVLMIDLKKHESNRVTSPTYTLNF